MENAITACPDPGEIRISAVEMEIDGAAGVCVYIRDNGPGIPSDQISQIFEPFFTTKKKGTGLGMAIAHRIVEAHSGTIKIGDSEGAGAEIIIALPRNLE